VSGLILSDTRSEADTNEGKVKRSAVIRTVKEQGVAVFAEQFLKTVFAPASFQQKPQVVARVRDMILSMSPLGICGTLLALAARTDTTGALTGVKVPTLICVGEQDQLTPPAAARSLHERIPGSQFVIVPDAGHLPNLENPETFNRHLISFLKQFQSHASA
jgi:pimeloyl-ACP methyl ester carboxylesterase